MRLKTSFTFDESTMPIARARAEADGLEISRWIEQAILHEASRHDVEVIDKWEQSLPEEEQALLAAFAELDRNPTDTAE